MGYPIDDPFGERLRPPQGISPVTRRDVFDYLRTDGRPWFGQMSEVAFLNRLYQLDLMPSTDRRFATATEDILQHRVRNDDWPDDWVFDDPRFRLASGPDQLFLDFLAQVVHPVVQPNAGRSAEIALSLNGLLEADGWMLKQTATMSGRPVYAPVRTAAMPARPQHWQAANQPRVPSNPASAATIRGHVFISYVRQDSARVDWLQDALSNQGIRVWRDTADLWPGEDWQAKIRHAITSDALVFLACFSRNSLARTVSYQNEELLLAIEQLRRRHVGEPWLIPVRFDDCDIPELDIGGGRILASIQRADLFGAHFAENLARLITAIVRILGPTWATPQGP